MLSQTIKSLFSKVIKVLIRDPEAAWFGLNTAPPMVAARRLLARRDTASWRWESGPLPPAEKLCVFVTYAPAGLIPERAVQHAAIWREAGYEVLFVIALDDFTLHPAVPFGHAICRQNRGHDFAAWSRALVEVSLENTRILATVNDSVFASPRLALAIAGAEANEADVVGFTDCHEYRWHMQSYAVVFKGDCIRSSAFRRFWKPRLGSRRDVILTYEFQLARTMAAAGYKVAILFPLQVRENPTHHHWPKLAARGFPYLKRSALPDYRKQWEHLFAEHGFDTGLIERDSLQVNA